MNEAKKQLTKRRGAALKVARNRAGLSAEELADKATEIHPQKKRITNNAVYSYERGRVCLPVFKARLFAQVLAIEASELLCEGSTSVANPAPTKNTLEIVLQMTGHQAGVSQVIRYRRWRLIFDPEQHRLQIYGDLGTSPKNIQLCLRTQDEWSPLQIQPDVVRADMMKLDEAAFQKLLDLLTRAGTEDDDIGAMLRFTEPLLISELRQWLIPQSKQAGDEENREEGESPHTVGFTG